MDYESLDTTNEPLVPNEQVISVGEWVLYLFLLSIPLVNIIMLCIWAFGNEPNKTKSNFGKAALIWLLICLVLYSILIFVFWAFILSQIPEFQNLQTV